MASKSAKKNKILKFKLPKRIAVTQEELKNNSDLISEKEMQKKTDKIFNVQKMMADIRDYSLKRIFSSSEGIHEDVRICNKALELLMPVYVKIGIGTGQQVDFCESSIIHAVRSIVYSYVERMIEDLLIKREVLEETSRGVAVSKRVLNQEALFPLDLEKEGKEVASEIVLKGFFLIRKIDEDVIGVIHESLELLKINFNKGHDIRNRIEFYASEINNKGYERALSSQFAMGGK